MQNIIERVAELHGTTVEEARAAMEEAIRETGLDLDLEVFIMACAARAQSVPEVAPRVAAAGGKTTPGIN